MSAATCSVRRGTSFTAWPSRARCSANAVPQAPAPMTAKFMRRTQSEKTEGGTQEIRFPWKHSHDFSFLHFHLSHFRNAGTFSPAIMFSKVSRALTSSNRSEERRVGKE